MSRTDGETVIAGFIPLLDSALLVAAAERGFARAEGIRLKLVRETSWANIRDRISIGHFDVAHMLAPMPIAASLNITSLAVPMLAPMTLGLGGNAITVSNALWARMAASGASGDGDAASTGRALARVIAARPECEPPLRFGVVHPFSGHAYELRYWLAASGIHPDRDVEISVLPPSLMADALKADRLDGYCVGEPWNTAATLGGTGRIVTSKAAIWPGSPEKVLGVTRSWAEEHGDTLAALIRALARAADWCGDAGNHADLAALLSGPAYLDCPADWCRPALGGLMALSRGEALAMPDFLSFTEPGALRPSADHALWFYSQMLRWGQVAGTAEREAIVRETYRPDLFSAAMAGIDGTGSGGQPGRAGPPQRFYDGVPFTPQDVAGYVAKFPIRA
jgi:NitT/TauT family transport system ATP-binding protein